MFDVKTTQLLNAIERLKLLTLAIGEVKEKVCTPIPSKSIVKKILQFTTKLFAPSKEIDPREMYQTLELIVNAVPLIRILQQGSKDQRELACRAVQVITEYNHLIDSIGREKTAHKNYEFPNGLINRKIELPTKNSVVLEIVSKPKNLISGTVHSLFAERMVISDNKKLSPDQVDLFRMKAITLLKETLGIKSAILAVKNSPIQEVWDETHSSQMILKQTISTFPGEIRILTAKFAQSNGGMLLNLDCTFSVHQTGFPAPSQYTGGFVLPYFFIQEHLNSPLHLELMQEKRTVANALLPGGEKYEKAKSLIFLKKEAFLAYKEEFLRQHLQFTLLLLGEAFGEELNQEKKVTVFNYFDYLSKVSQPFEKMVEVSEGILRNLKNERLSDSFHDEKTVDYILLLTEAMMPTLKRLSSKTKLTNFDKKVLFMAYYQQCQFFKELNDPAPISLEMTVLQMRVYLSQETSLFLNEEINIADLKAEDLAKEAIFQINEQLSSLQHG